MILFAECDLYHMTSDLTVSPEYVVKQITWDFFQCMVYSWASLYVVCFYLICDCLPLCVLYFRASILGGNDAHCIIEMSGEEKNSSKVCVM